MIRKKKEEHMDSSNAPSTVSCSQPIGNVCPYVGDTSHQNSDMPLESVSDYANAL